MFTVDAPLFEISDALRHGHRSASEYLSEVLDRADAVEPVLRTLLPEPGRRERVIADAHELLRRHPKDEGRPPLFGIPIGVKDLLSVAGMPTRCGSALPPEVFREPEAPVVTGLRAQGGIIMGKTTMDEFAWTEPSAARNPVNPEHTAGGSSAGSAAGVAAGIFPLAVGTQTSRSIIGPAAFCGVVGYKPTYGRVPTDGLTFLAPSLDVIGLFTQDPAGMLLAASVFVPGWRPEPPRRLPRLGVPDGPFLLPVTGEPRRIFDAQLEALRWAGYEIEHVLFYSREDLAEYDARATNLIHGEMARVHDVWVRDSASLYRPGTLRAIETGRRISESELAVARDGQEVLRDAIHSLMDENEIDFWICPASNGPAPRGDRPTGYGAMTTIWSYAGLPALCLPGATTGSGLPLGLQLIARFGGDEALVDAARYVHRKLDEPNQGSPARGTV